MDGAIVIAALVLNPIARRKRAAGTAEPAQAVEIPTASTSGSGDSNPPEKSDLESGDRPAADKAFA